MISGALFLCVGVVYDRMHTREIAFYGGLVNRMPWYAAIFMLFTMGNVGLPGTSGFVGEILTMTGAYQVSTWTALVAATGVILSAVYALTPLPPGDVRRDHQPEARRPSPTSTGARWLIFVPLIVATLVAGRLAQRSCSTSPRPRSTSSTAAYRAAIGG